MNGSMSGFIEKLRSNRRLEILVYSALILTAVIIFVSSGGISCSSIRGEAASSAVRTDSRSGLESRLESVLSSIEGAGRVRVLICPAEKDEPSSGGLFGSSVSETGAAGAPYVGAIIVAEGAGDLMTASRLREAAMTVLGLEAGSVSVFAMEAPEK